MKNRAFFLIVFVVMTEILFFYSITTSQASLRTVNTAHEIQQQKKREDAACLTSNKPKPDVKLHLGALNGKTKNMPEPTYPIEARRKRIYGEVKVEVVINLVTGVIEWARIETGENLLRKAVSKVICGVEFYPTNDADIRASGYLIYKFYSNQKCCSNRKRQSVLHRAKPEIAQEYNQPFLRRGLLAEVLQPQMKLHERAYI
jgi:hypothetical protein